MLRTAGNIFSSVTTSCRNQIIVARAQEGWNGNKKLRGDSGNGAFIRSIPLVSPAEQIGAVTSSTGSPQLSASPELKPFGAFCRPQLIP